MAGEREGYTRIPAESRNAPRLSDGKRRGDQCRIWLPSDDGSSAPLNSSSCTSSSNSSTGSWTSMGAVRLRSSCQPRPLLEE
jgi:hypothetical protein